MSDDAMKKLPAFKSEGEEANWWFDHREEHAEEFVRAIDSGKVARGAMAARGVTRTEFIELDPEDVPQARALAEQRGLNYRTYLRVLLHDAFERERKRLVTEA